MVDSAGQDAISHHYYAAAIDDAFKVKSNSHQALIDKLRLIADYGGSRLTGDDCREEALAALALAGE